MGPALLRTSLRAVAGVAGGWGMMRALVPVIAAVAAAALALALAAAAAAAATAAAVNDKPKANAGSIISAMEQALNRSCCGD